MVSMSHPDDVARLREIKRLLDRIQRLPRLAGMPFNEPMNGPMHEPLHEPPQERAAAAGPANGVLNGNFDRRPAVHGGAAIGPPHPTAEANLGAEHKHEPASRLAPLDSQLDPLPASFDARLRDDRDDARSDYWTRDQSSEPRALVLARPPAATGLGISPWVFIVATAVNTVVAAVLAIVITLGVARRDTGPAETEKIAVAVKPAAEGQPELVPRPVELLPVGSAKQPLRLEALKPARLPFEVRPAEAIHDGYFLVLNGLPPNAVLSGASRLGGTDAWHLAPGALQRLEIVVPEWSATVYEVGVELRRTNGVVAARSKLWLSVPPPTTPTGASLDEAALKELVRSGDKLLSRGDVAAARAYYERAAAMGSAQAALGMGTTFDQRQLWALGVFGMVGSKDRARAWYQRADELGHPDAKARIVALQ